MIRQKPLITIVLIIIIAILGYFGYRGYQYISIDVRDYESFEAFLEQEQPSNREIEIYTEKLKEAYAEDTYGSTTPEGTFVMFIEALEDDDLELASKYFIPEDQKIIFQELEESKKNNVLSIIIESADNREVSVGEIEASVRIYEEGENTPFLFLLKKNRLSDLWKMENI